VGVDKLSRRVILYSFGKYLDNFYNFHDVGLLIVFVQKLRKHFMQRCKSEAERFRNGK